MKSSKSSSVPQSYKTPIIVAALLALLGIALWAFQQISGFDLTHMSNANPWGLYIMSFVFMVGVAGGSLAVAAVPRLMKLRSFEPIERLAVWVSICSAVLAMGFVLVDLGGPLRVWELFAYSNLSSPLMWDIIALPLFLIVSIAYLWVLIRTDRGTSARALNIVAALALVAAIVLCTVDAWIFGLQQGRVMWNAPLLPVWFIISALATGLALMMMLSALFGKLGGGLSNEAFAKMAKCLGAVVIADLFCLACDVVFGLYAGAQHSDTLGMLFSGELAPVFWIEAIAGVAAAVILMGGKATNRSPAIAAACLALISVFCKRIQFLMVGFSNMQAPFPGMATAGTANTNLLAAAPYIPSFVEVGMVLAVVAFGALLLMVGLRYLPLSSRQNDR